MERALSNQKPEARALMTLDTLPSGCTAFLCANKSSLPLVAPGEFVVVDRTDRVPSPDGLFVIRFGKDVRNHHICVTRRGSGFGRTDGWRVGAVVNDRIASTWALIRRRPDLSEVDRGMMLVAANNAARAWTEGPYWDDGPSYEHLCNCLVGRIIGIYAPTFEEPKREAS